MKRLELVIICFITALSVNACRHAANHGDSPDGSSASGGALQLTTTDSIKSLKQSYTPALTDTANKMFKADSIKKNP